MSPFRGLSCVTIGGGGAVGNVSHGLCKEGGKGIGAGEGRPSVGEHCQSAKGPKKSNLSRQQLLW